MHARRPAFSFVELMVVIGIIGLLLSLLMAGIQRVREAAARTACLNNLRQIGTALHHYHVDHGGFPPRPVRGVVRSRDPSALLGWMALVLPYVEQDSLHASSIQACQVDRDTLKNPPHVGLATVVKLYVCPTDGRLLSPLVDSLGVRAAFTSYIGIAGTLPPGARVGQLGVLGGIPGRSLRDVIDGTSNTIMVGERPPPDSLQAGLWYPSFHWHTVGFRGPNNGIVLGAGSSLDGEPCRSLRATFSPGRTGNPCDRFHLWSLHPGGANFLFVDGSARYLSYGVEPMILALGSINGGEVVEID